LLKQAKKKISKFTKNFGTGTYFYPKIVTKLSKNGFRILDPGSVKNLFQIPDPGVKKAPGSESGSVTLHVQI
jgi:hypothetical protein